MSVCVSRGRFSMTMETELHTAAADGDVDGVLRLLWRGADANVLLPAIGLQRGVSRFTALQQAVASGNMCTVEALLTHGVAVNAVNQEGLSALHLAAGNGRADITRVLLSYGADVSAVSSFRDTPLFSAIRYRSHVDVIKILLQHGADASAVGLLGNTALHLACRTGLVEIIRTLLAHDVDANLINDAGDTPLLVACQYFHLKAVTVLLTHGVDVNVANKKGRTTLTAASSNFHQAEILERLIEHGADLSGEQAVTALFSNSGLGPSPAALKVLLAHGVDGNTMVESTGRTALHFAASFDQIDKVRVLLAFGVDINRVDKEGLTPLMCAAIAGHTRITELLKAYGAK